MAYNYVYINPIDGLPFYIGKGNKNRYKIHLKLIKQKKHYNKYFQNKVLKIQKKGYEPDIRIFNENVSDEVAYQQEMAMIQGLKIMGIKLTNLNDGGFNGSNPSKETRKKMSLAHQNQSKETRKKIGNARRGKKDSIETKLKKSKSQKKRIISEETKKKMSISAKNRSEKTRKNMSDAQKGKKTSEETKRKLSIASKNISDETRRKMSIANKLQWKKRKGNKN